MIPQLSVTCVTISEEEPPWREAAIPRLEGLKLLTLEYAEAIQALGPALGHHYLASARPLSEPGAWSPRIAPQSPNARQ
jgi:hypothetical protein